MYILEPQDYETMTKDQAIDGHDWGYDLKEDEAVFYARYGLYDIFVGHANSDEYTCEIEGFTDPKHWGMLGQGFADSPRAAIVNAVLDVVHVVPLRENGNSEDAANCLAYEAYQFIYGETPMYRMSVSKMDELLGASAAFVKDYGFDD